MECRVELRKRHPGQARIVGESRRFNVLMCGRRFGKTALGIDLGVEEALGGGRVGWFAPSYKYLEEAWREVVGTVTPLKGVSGFDKSETEHRLALPGGGVVECWTMDTDDPGRGRHYTLAVVDEAGLVPGVLRIWNGAIRPTLLQDRGRLWMFGTPKVQGGFSELWDRGQDGVAWPDWVSWRMSTKANPWIPVEEIEAMRRESPEADYRREVLGEVVDEGEHPIGLEHIRACVGQLSEAEPVVWGVDLARSVDFTVAVGLDAGGHVCRTERWKAPWGVTRARLVAILGQTVSYVDCTGVGDPIVEDLQRAGTRVVPSMFTARSKQQWVEGLIAGVQQRRIRYPDGFLVRELVALQAERTATGTRYGAPEGSHDDGVMALSLAWHGWREMGYPKVKQEEDGWKRPDRARKLELEDGRWVKPTKDPQTLAQLDEWLGRNARRTHLPVRQRERLPLRSYR